MRRVKYVSEDKHTQKKRFQSYESVLNGSQRAHMKIVTINIEDFFFIYKYSTDKSVFN